MNKDMIKPQKRDTVLLNEKLESFNTDETGIDESNKKILLRELKPSINLLNNERGHSPVNAWLQNITHAVIHAFDQNPILSLV